MRPALPAALALLLCACTGCRAFPVGLYVPDSVLDALEDSRFSEQLAEDALAHELGARAGVALTPRAEPAPGHYHRLDLEPVLGPLAPEAFARRTDAPTRGLRPGDLVLVKNPRAQSLATTLALAEFTYYDHMGVLVERAGRWLVCDSWPSFHPFAKARDFADRFRGGVRATPLATFLVHYETLLFVRVAPEPEGAALADLALASLAEGLEFDPHHDARDPRLSCCEYIELLLTRAGRAPELVPRALHPNEELRTLLAALGFPPGGFLVPDQFAELAGAHAVAWLSRHPTRAAARAREAAYRTLWLRFGAAGRVGDFLGIDRFRLLRLRANVGAFLRWSVAWAEARGLERREALERELAPLLPLFLTPAR